MTGVKRTLKPKENFQKYISFGFPSAKKLQYIMSLFARDLV